MKPATPVKTGSRSPAPIKRQAERQRTVNPILQRALAAIDINLEDELHRYRRAKAGKPLPQSRSFGFAAPYRGREAPRLRSHTLKPQFATPENTRLPESSLGSPQTPPQLEGRPSAPETAPQIAPPQIAPSSLGDLSFQVAEAGNAASGDIPRLDRAIASQIANLQTAALPTSPPQADDAGSENVSSGEIAPEADPEDYLESSRELLEKTAAPPPGQSEEKEGATDSDRVLLVPLGFGLLLLALLAIAAGVFAFLNPESVGLQRSSGGSSGDSSGESQPEKSTETVAIAPALSPNLAEREFAPLELESLSTIDPDPAAARKAIVPESASEEAVSRATASQRPEEVPARESGLDELQSAILPDISTLSVLPTELDAAKAYFYAVAPFEGPSSLVRARQTFPKASLQKFSDGDRILFEIFTDEGTARAFVEQLRQKGVRAEVYQPSDQQSSQTSVQTPVQR